MNNSKALEALKNNVAIISEILVDESKINITSEYAVREIRKYFSSGNIYDALTELEEIKKRAEEYAIRLEEEKGKPYSMLLLGEDKVIDLINYILKGETK